MGEKETVLLEMKWIRNVISFLGGALLVWQARSARSLDLEYKII
jgi:hypothetical protein